MPIILLRKYGNVFAVVVLALTVTFGFTSVYRGFVGMTKAAEWTTHTHEVLVAISRLRAAIYAAELAGTDPKPPGNLAPNPFVARAVSDVVALTADNPCQQASCEKLREMLRTGTRADLDPAINDMLVEERKLLQKRLDAQNDAGAWMIVTLVGMTVLAATSMSFLLGSAWTATRQRADLESFVASIPGTKS